jgi:hypothetical protein
MPEVPIATIRGVVEHFAPTANFAETLTPGGPAGGIKTAALYKRVLLRNHQLVQFEPFFGNSLMQKLPLKVSQLGR